MGKNAIWQEYSLRYGRYSFGSKTEVYIGQKVYHSRAIAFAP